MLFQSIGIGNFHEWNKKEIPRKWCCTFSKACRLSARGQDRAVCPLRFLLSGLREWNCTTLTRSVSHHRSRGHGGLDAQRAGPIATYCSRCSSLYHCFCSFGVHHYWYWWSSSVLFFVLLLLLLYVAFDLWSMFLCCCFLFSTKLLVRKKELNRKWAGGNKSTKTNMTTEETT